MKKQKEDSIRIRIESGLKEKYQKYCDDNSFSLSKRLRLFIEKDLENKLEINH